MAGQWMTILIGVLMWMNCSAAPTECHFNAQALCEYEGKHYLLGQSWMETGCIQCTCLHPFGVGCCETVQQPVDFPPWCQVRVESVTCKVSLVLTSDPRLPCNPGEGNIVDPSHGEMNIKLAG
ncbi:prostate-associated microseminoprotein [Tachysurus vachellii]|uniref:prostate-associated microseminoprotein n=1 Tax=Tachysurus vachellii TaxID=175792 RepID=UPI00296B46A0|nr:prostate-associated microseminoprotein [Tachysurus vachellii]